MSKRYDYGKLYLSTGGLLLAGAGICFVAGTISVGGLVAAGIASYVCLTAVNSLDRADKRGR